MTYTSKCTKCKWFATCNRTNDNQCEFQPMSIWTRIAETAKDVVVIVILIPVAIADGLVDAIRRMVGR